MNYGGKKKSYETKRFPIEKSYKCSCHKGKAKQACIEEVLGAILKAQKKVEENNKRKDFSYKESIKKRVEKPKKAKKNTIPFILYCSCEPFKATGVTTIQKGKQDDKLSCISSYIFKIIDLKDHCAELELLTFKHKKERDKKDLSLCDQINHKKVEDLENTGVCIHIDLSYFCGVTYLPAVHL